jgi:pimeloyl-ACP methyl ester carboxylesterase
VSIVCGLGPPDIGMSGANWINWVGFTFGLRYSPPLFIHWFYRHDPTGRLDLTDEQRLELMLQPSRLKALNEKDLEIMRDEDILRMVLRSTREAFAQGYDWIRQDGKLMCTDFGFKIEDIRHDLPVQLWYGRQDTNVPCNHGEQIAARLGARAHLKVLDETHSTIFFNHRKEILQDLIREM